MIISLILLAVAAFFFYKSYVPETGTFDPRNGGAAILAVLAAAWAYVSDFASYIANW